MSARTDLCGAISNDRPYRDLTERSGHKSFQISGFWADYGQLAPYPSLAVRARNGRVADYTCSISTLRLGSC
jgi:hypothetical protein